MRRALIALLLIATQAQAEVRTDGNWWAQLDSLNKAFYVTGYLDGAAATAAIAPAAICLHQNWTGSALEKCVSTAWQGAHEAFVKPFIGRPYGQFVEGVNSFYVDYRNKGICFKIAIRIVQEEMNGMTGEKVKSWLEQVRSIPVTQSCQ